MDIEKKRYCVICAHRAENTYGSYYVCKLCQKMLPVHPKSITLANMFIIELKKQKDIDQVFEVARQARATHRDTRDQNVFYKRVVNGLMEAHYKNGQLTKWELSSMWFYPPEHSEVL